MGLRNAYQCRDGTYLIDFIPRLVMHKKIPGKNIHLVTALGKMTSFYTILFDWLFLYVTTPRLHFWLNRAKQMYFFFTQLISLALPPHKITKINTTNVTTITTTTNNTHVFRLSKRQPLEMLTVRHWAEERSGSNTDLAIFSFTFSI